MDLLNILGSVAHKVARGEMCNKLSRLPSKDLHAWGFPMLAMSALSQDYRPASRSLQTPPTPPPPNIAPPQSMDKTSISKTRVESGRMPHVGNLSNGELKRYRHASLCTRRSNSFDINRCFCLFFLSCIDITSRPLYYTILHNQ